MIARSAIVVQGPRAPASLSARSRTYRPLRKAPNGTTFCVEVSAKVPDATGVPQLLGLSETYTS